MRHENDIMSKEQKQKTRVIDNKTTTSIDMPSVDASSNNRGTNALTRPVEVRRAATLFFVIPGQPFGKQRARSGKAGTHYTPIKTKRYENHVAWCGAKEKFEQRHSSVWPTSKQVYLDLWIYHANGLKPDSDNVVKAIEDGLSGILWKNDRNVLPRVQAEVWPDDNPRVEVEISFTGYELKGKKPKKVDAER